jgi:cytochrome c-type biogenesis protein CcmH
VNLFWFLAGMLSMLAALIVLLPWLRTIPNFASLPAVPWPAPLISLAVIGAALAMYHWLGSPQSLTQSPGSVVARPAQIAAPNGRSGAAGSMDAAINSLRARLAAGGTADDWELLAKSYEFLGQPDAARQARAHQLPAAAEASSSAAAAGAAATPAAAAAPAAMPLSAESLKSLAKAQQLRHEKQYAAADRIYKQLAAAKQMNADAWADYADTAATLQGDKLAGAPEGFIANALALDANHPKALWLKASADEEAGRVTSAIDVWLHLQKVLPQDSQDAVIVAANLQRDLASASPNATAAAATPSGSSISGEVTLSASLLSKAQPGATLFIVAKSVDVPGPPVAVYRGSVSAWPVKFTLDDSLSMLPGRNLTNARRVTVEARVSSSGQAQPAAGDLRGVSGVIDPSSHEPLKIIINEVVT